MHKAIWLAVLIIYNLFLQMSSLLKVSYSRAQHSGLFCCISMELIVSPQTSGNYWAATRSTIAVKNSPLESTELSQLSLSLSLSMALHPPKYWWAFSLSFLWALTRQFSHLPQPTYFDAWEIWVLVLAGWSWVITGLVSLGCSHHALWWHRTALSL